jgi:phosphohistidine phosphatase
VKRLILFRHAKTEADSPSGEDFDRRLTAAGREAASRMGDRIRELGLAPDHRICSPAQRAVETAGLAGLDAGLDERIYNASAGELLAIIQSAPEPSETLLLIGHNPGLEMLASQLGGTPIAMPTGSLIEIGLPANRWEEAGQLVGTPMRFLTPADPA